MRVLRSSLCLAFLVSATAPQASAQWTTVGDLIYTFDRVNIGTQSSNYSVGIVAEDNAPC